MSTDAVNAAVDTVTAVLLIAGSFMSLAAAVGLWRFPDQLSRMHSATKPQVLGLLLLLLAVGLQLRNWALVPMLVLAWLIQLLTVPVSAHMVGRAGYRTQHLRKETLSLDELQEVVEKAARQQQSAGQPDDGGR